MQVGAIVVNMHTGRCLCGAVSYRAQQLRDIWFCHCRQCRYVTGHFMAACRTEKDQLEWDGEVKWSPHSNTSELGRCTQCGGPLFWYQTGSETYSVMAGSLDDTGGLTTSGHIFTAERGGYYAIVDDLPQSSGHTPGGC